MNWNLKRRIVEIYGSQSDFAETAKASDAYISRIVRGRRELSESEKHRWSVLLRCKKKEIFE